MAGDQHRGGWGFQSVVIQSANKKFQMLFTRQCLVFSWWGFSQSCMTLATPWTVARQVPLSVRFSRQEYWSGLPCPPPRTLPHPGIEPASLMPPVLAGRFFTTSATNSQAKLKIKLKD